MKNTVMMLVLSILLFLSIPLSMGYALDDSEQVAKDRPAEIVALIDQLGADTYEAREKAYKVLAGYGDEARPFLKKALDNEDAEIRWRASRLLAELEGRIVVQLDEPPPTRSGDESDLGLFKNRLKKLKELPDFGRRPFDDEFFKQNDDFFKGPFGDIFKEFLGKDTPLRFHRFDNSGMPDMGLLMKELGKNEGGININIDGQKLSYRMERHDGETSETCTFDLEGDGSVVATVITKDKEGNEEEKTYEAKDMEAFKKSYPEISEKFDLGSTGLSFSFPGSRGIPFGFNLRKEGSNPSLKWSIPKLEIAQRKTLGVYLDPEGPGKVLRAHIGLKDHEGVIIEKVLHGSFADKIEIKPMDIITSINGQCIGSAEDVGKALEAVQDGDDVEVKVYRNGEQKKLKGVYKFKKARRI